MVAALLFQLANHWLLNILKKISHWLLKVAAIWPSILRTQRSLVVRHFVICILANFYAAYLTFNNTLPVQVVVAINQFKTDTEAEMQAIRQASLDAGAYDAVVSNHWAEGGKGAEMLAAAVEKACNATNSDDFKYLYDLNLPIREKVEIISKEIYGADGVDFSELAEQQMVRATVFKNNDVMLRDLIFDSTIDSI
jgi:hypothetical protein